MNANNHQPVDLMAETLISLSQAARRLPPFRKDRPVSPATIWRWIFDGVLLPDNSRLKLEAVRMGGRWVTSVEALGRFAERQTSCQRSTATDSSSPVQTPTQRERAHQKANEQLDKAGL